MPDRFLYLDAAERERLLDLSVRLRPKYAVAVCVMAIPGALGAHVYGIAAAVPLLLSAIAFAVLTSGLDHRRRPELALFASCSFGLLMTLLSIWLADGPKEYLFATPVFPMLGMAPIFARRVSISAVLLTCVGLVAVALGSYGDEVRAQPPMLILPVMLLILTVLGAMASRNAEHLHRGTAIVDPLTGLLNRVALQGRATELALHAERGGERVGLLIADLDCFKLVNDEHGHAIGDAVLVEVASRLRAELGTEGLIFRFGGEEFVVLLPSMTPVRCVAWAERMRTVIRDAPVAGLRVSASFGAAISEPGEAFDYRSLFRLADAALYQAKQRGRDRVCSALELLDEQQVARAPASLELDLGADPASAPDPPAAIPRSRRGHGRDSDGNWLVGDAVERAHVVDLLQRAQGDSRLNAAIALAGTAACCLWCGWLLLLPAVAAVLFWSALGRRLPTARRPEFGVLAGLSVLPAAVGIAAVVASPQNLFALPLIGFATFGACATFRRVGALVVAGAAVIAAVATGFAIDAAAIMANPVIVAYPLALIISCAYLGEGMGGVARDQRVNAITDSLTGVLNRGALEIRIPELVQRSLAGLAPTSLLVVDIDHFKAVNDRHGHDAGDAVLVAVAARLTAGLRTFDSVYRIGGEEFVVVLTDTRAEDALGVAERLRRAVEAAPVQGVSVTVSAGVATGGAGTAFDYDATFAMADRCLYVAKRGGRNRVVGEPVIDQATIAA